MTISQPPSQNASPSGAPRAFHIPARPSASSSGGQSLPTWQSAPSPEEAESPALPESPLPAAVDAVPTLPLPVPTTRVYRRDDLPPAPLASWRRGRLALWLPLLALLVVLAGLLGQHWFSTSAAIADDGPLTFSGTGPYAQLPLSASQITAIEHLSGHMRYKALASLYVSHMSLDEEIGQLIMVEYNQPAYSSDLDYMIHTLHAGGVILYEFQMNTLNQTKADITHMQQRATIPLIITTDEEGGPYVRRLDHIYGPRMSPTQIAETGNLAVATQQGLKVSKDLAALGLNSDLAPDVDVNQVNGYDMVTRTFGNTSGQVIQFAGAYMQAMQGNGTIACIKHYPGLGGATPDAHKTLPVVNSSRQQIYAADLAPFKAFIQSPEALLNPGMIMPTDVLMPAIDPTYPAELSHIFMTDILRTEFGYDGVVLTDALYMQGITKTWDMYTASVMALAAGNDMLLGANGTQQTLGVINAIKQALHDGRLTRARIDESVTRIIALKMQYHLLPLSLPEP